MARAAAVASVLCAPVAAFAPQGNLRAQPVESLQQPSAEVPAGALPSGQSLAARSPVAGVALGGLAAVGIVAAAAQAKGRNARGASRVERRVVGVCMPLTEKWDPLDLGNTEAKMERYTLAEIKHGRVAMIACLGYVMPEVFRFPGCEAFDSGLGVFSTLPTEGLAQLFLFIGAHEFIAKPRADGLGPWDLGLGTELLDGIPEEELERRQTSERNNGRLAMVGILGLIAQDSMFGKSPILLLKTDGWWGPAADFIIQDVPICRGGGGMCASAGEEPRMSTSVPFLKHPKQLDGWVGGEKGFDPLGCTDALPLYLVREAELKHGRVCMLATVGWIATDLGVRFPGEAFQGVSTVDAHNAMVQAGVMGPFLATIGVYELYSGWLCLEGFEGKIKREAGDFFLGKNFLPKEEDKAKEMRMKEIENGRLAMVAFSGICTQAVLTGKTWPFL